jgi:type I restriction enzyme S subunit
MSWKKVKIKDFAETITGGTPSTTKKEYWEGGTIPWLNSGELNQRVVTYSTNFITEKGLKESNAKMMPSQTVLIALTGATTGMTAFLTFEACANQSVTGVLPSSEHYPRFLYYYLSSIRNKILSDSYGGAQKHISQGYVQNIQIPLPPLSTQQKIAAILDKADELRRKDKILLAQYDALLQSTFYNMFGDPVKNDKGWDKVRLEHAAHKITDGEHQTPKREDSGYKLLSARNVKNGFIDFEAGLDFIGEDEFRRISKRCSPEFGDLLISCSGSIGRVTAVKVKEHFSLVRSVALVKLNRDLLDGLFAENLFQTEFLQSQILRRAKASSQANLFTGPIKELSVILPPINLQREFAEIVRNIESQKQQIKQQIQQSENLFQSLLQKAFKGELIK